MAYDQDIANLTNLKHAKDPQIGDYWHECFTPIAVVVDVSRFSIVLCEKTKSPDEKSWTWDLDKLEVYTKKDFVNRFRYGRVGKPKFKGTDDMTSIKNKFWCDVSPKAHEWVIDALDEREKKECHSS